jgi:hypothetical protein
MLTEPGEYVTIHNTGDSPFTYRCLGKFHTIDADARKTVPWAHLDHLMGNPFLRNNGRDNIREQEYRRIHALYGTENDNQKDKWPKLEAYDSDGERIVTIYDDPRGENALTSSDHEDLDAGAMRAQMDRLKSQMKQLQSLIQVNDRATAASQIEVPSDTSPLSVAPPREIVADEVLDDVAVDTPTKTPVTRSRKSS